MHYKSTTKRADEIGRELGVGYLLETSLRRIGNHLRITAQLIDARSQGHVWVEQYERDAQDILALQGEVAAAVTRRTMLSLGVNPPEPVLQHGATVRTVHWLTSTISVGGIIGSRARPTDCRKRWSTFGKPSTLDPSYARAYSGLADTYALLGSYDIMPISESHPLGRQAALKALELDDSLGEAHRALAAILADHYWDWAEVERHYKRAMELDPNDATTLRFYSFYLAYTGRPVEALPIAEQACSLDPVSPNARMNLGAILYLARRFDDAGAGVRGDARSGSEFQLRQRRARAGVRQQRDARPRRCGSCRRRAGCVARVPTSSRSMDTSLARAGRRREALTALDDLRRLARPAGPFAVPRGACLHRSGGQRPRVRVARKGD